MMPFSAVALVAAAELPEQVSTTPCPAPLELALATDNPTAQLAVKAAMLDLLLGWNESARVHFARAVEADNTCTLAYAGLWMTDADPARLKENLANLTEKFHQSAGTPIERQISKASSSVSKIVIQSLSLSSFRTSVTNSQAQGIISFL